MTAGEKAWSYQFGHALKDEGEWRLDGATMPSSLRSGLDITAPNNIVLDPKGKKVHWTKISALRKANRGQLPEGYKEVFLGWITVKTVSQHQVRLVNPELWEKNRPHPKASANGSYEEDLEALRQWIQDQGIEIERNPFGLESGDIRMGQNGPIISVNPQAADNAATEILILSHEVAHFLMGHLEEKKKPLAEMEQEAELAASFVLAALAKNEEDFNKNLLLSASYLSAWAERKDADMFWSINRCGKIADEILSAITD
jgi:hypothetical protein